MISVRLPTDNDCQALAPKLRDHDRREAAASVPGLSISSLIAESVDRSPVAWTVEVGGGAECMFGAARVDAVTGAPWMLLSCDFFDLVSPRQFYTDGWGYFARMVKAFPRQVNFILTESDVTRPWLRRLGYTIHPEVYRMGGEDFNKFTRGF